MPGSGPILLYDKSALGVPHPSDFRRVGLLIFCQKRRLLEKLERREA